ncbi:EAL domain-containing protein [Shewanella sp. Isolate13]|uniref:EAL domain-containing protein n=1 Tax=Shewanella sp. Isolate13 TaxID=2908531 RepID=UPI001EFE0C5E|nr:EAL domain-containing protein [Shewanella sp. Isolate13]MCG9731222.1 EAL domain-containing protein [Shewanella sp. Isolate13]
MPKILIKLATTLLFTILWVNSALALTLNSVSLGVSDGLSQSNVTSIVEDADGYIWIGTVNGLNRYDGKEFRHYFPSPENDLPSAFIRSLFISDSGNMYIGTDKGLAVYDRLTDRVIALNSETFIHEQAIWSISQSKENIIIGTEDSVYITQEKSQQPTLTLKKSYSGDFNGVKQALLFEDDVYIRNYAGEVRNVNKNSLLQINNSTSIKVINNNLIIFSIDGVFETNKSATRKISEHSFLSVSSGSDSFALNLNGIYNTLRPTEPLFIGAIAIESKDLNFSKINIFRGSEKTFIANQNKGFIIIDDNNNLIQSAAKNIGNVWSISNDNNRILVSTEDSKLKLYDSNFNLIKEFETGVTGIKTSTIIDDVIYTASNDGIHALNINTGKSLKVYEGSFFLIKSTTNNKSFIAGSSDGYILTYTPQTKTESKVLIDKNNPIFDIYEYENGLYISTQGGLFHYKKNNVEHIYKDEFVTSLIKTKNKLIFGTGTSIKSYNTTTKEINTIYSNSKPIFSLAIIGKYLYASSINEIITYNIPQKSISVLTNEIGAQKEYNLQSILIKGKSLYIGGISGISWIQTDSLIAYLKNSTPPVTVLNGLSIFNIAELPSGSILKNQLSETNNIKLKYSDYPFTLSFSSPGSSFKKINYAYQMQGLSDTYIHSKGTDSATYTNLSPGEYRFSIYAIDPVTGKQGPTRNLDIEITPPWWLSSTAKLVYLLFSLFISVLVIKTILRRREIQKQIAKSEERLKLSLWGSGDEMWDWDIETGQIYRSNIWGSLEFPQDGQRSGGEGEESNIHPMDQERVREALNKHFYGETDHFEATYRVKGKANEWIWILDRAKIVERDEHDNAVRMTGTIKNISNFKQAEEQLRLFERAIQNISEGMFILDRDFKFVEVNEACCDLAMLSKDAFIGSLFNFDLYPDSYSEQIRAILKQQGRWSNEIESARGNGTSFLMELSIDAIYDEQGELSHYVGVFSDVSRRKQQEEELRKLTNNDLLTNLPNRSNLMVTLGNLVKRDSHHTLMVLDLDNFKKINDSLGHQVGDELLVQVADRIQVAVPNHTSIYRLGGDEFAILVDKNPDIGTSAVIAKNVIHAFETPFELTNEKVVVGLSIGIVLYPEDDQNEQALLRKADIAMYHAKSAGGNRYQFYSESLNKNAIRQLEVENLIREGLKDDLFEVYYQPKVDLKSGQMAGMEALVRLNHPEHGLIPPNKFIPLAEENGLIVEIGDVVLKKACFAAQKWRTQGLFNGRVAVNLSSKQFALPDLHQRIESILQLTQLPADNLELEITEGTVIKEPEKAIKVMQQLTQMGVSLALDDFGTGYSSLSYLKRFPIHTLKIDKAFVDDIDKSDRDLKMVDSIITIAHNMGLSVVGEGVEEASQLSILRALKCEEIQGYIFSKAVTEPEFTKLLQDDANRDASDTLSTKNG